MWPSNLGCRPFNWQILVKSVNKKVWSPKTKATPTFMNVVIWRKIYFAGFACSSSFCQQHLVRERGSHTAAAKLWHNSEASLCSGGYIFDFWNKIFLNCINFIIILLSVSNAMLVEFFNDFWQKRKRKKFATYTTLVVVALCKWFLSAMSTIFNPE